MKKLAAALLSATLLLSSSVFAADIDLSGLTVDELANLRTQIDMLLEEKLEGQAKFGPGVFICGQDIKEGYYEFTATSEDGAYIFIYETKESWKNGDDWIGNSTVHEAGEVSTFSIHEGNCIEVMYGSGLLRENKPAWAPE